MDPYNMNQSDQIQRHLDYLDPECFVSSTPGCEIETEFICVVCTGVVLDPIECAQCQSLYCKVCLQNGTNMPCPKRCGGANYTKVNRLIMNALNKMMFKCKFAPKCEQTISYEQSQNPMSV